MKIISASLIVGAIVMFSFQATTFAAKRSVIIQDEATFYSYTAQLSSNPGSPVGPKPKVTICHKGHTRTVSLAAVPGHLAHGDSIGACPPRTSIKKPPGWFLFGTRKIIVPEEE
jgi:hypothetical protein